MLAYMASRLKAILNVTALGPGASITLAHGLNVNGASRKPDRIDRGLLSTLEFSDVTRTTLTITNTGGEAVTGRVLAEAWHSSERVLGGLDELPGGAFITGGSGEIVVGGGEDLSLVAVSDSLTTAEDTPLVANVLTNDTTTTGVLSVLSFRVQVNGDDPGETTFDVGNTATIAGVGALRINANGALSFTPLANYAGAVPTVSYLMTNGTGVRLSTVNITVTPANDAPVASPDARITLVNTPITFNLLGNDYDPDNDAISVSHIDAAPVAPTDAFPKAGGTLVYDGAGQVTFTPAADFTGTETFDYTITDGDLMDTTTITILVGAANEPLFSAAAPISGAQGTANYNFMLTYRGLYGQAYNNGVNVTAPPYSANQGLFDLNNREPWLYDRASTVYALYLRTQDPAILDQAFTLADLYMAGVDVTAGGLGRFVIVGGAAGADVTDIKYLYPIIAEWYEKEKLRLGLPNADAHRAKGIALYRQALASFSKTYNPTSAALWTERNAGYAIQACVAAHYLYRRAGNLSASLTALQDAWDYFTMVEGMSAATGAPLHGHNQHEGSAITTPISSPWMSAFFAESVLQLYRADPDDRILTWLSNYGDWIIANAIYTTDGSELAPLAGLPLPAYLAANTGTPTTYREGELLDMEHAADVAGLMRKVLWAKTELSLSTTAVETLITGLDAAAVIVWAYWTRDTEQYPRYRVNPPRKGGWWFRNTYSDESLFFTGQVPTLPLAITAVTIAGSSQQGAALTATPGSWDGFPAPTVTHQWYRGATPIAGATATTYDTVEDDIGEAITCRETATSDGGEASTTSNAVNIVAAGAPEILVHPANVQGEVDGTVQFSAECEASPTADFQWQYSDDGGVTPNNVVGGTGGSGNGNTTTYTTPALTALNNGRRYRCGFTNANGTVYTDWATLAMIVDQGAAEFSSNTSGAIFTFDIGDVGISDFVIEALMYFPANSANANFLGIRHSTNGRAVIIGMNNTFEVWALGPRDTQTGHTAWPSQPPPNTWVHVTMQCTPSSGTDTIRATWALAEGPDDTRTATTRANGVENSVQGQQVFVGGVETGQASQGAMRVQHVRARTGNLADAVVDGHRHDTDTSGWAYWWKFVDAGGGVLSVQDLTGNGRTPTITGGSFVAGPVVPGPA